MAAKQGKKQRKWGHNKRKPSFQRYMLENRLYKHKVSKITKHLDNNPNDHNAEVQLSRIKSLAPRIRAK